METIKAPGIGTIVWTDLTVPDAEHIRHFYQEVVGWQADAVDMEGYNDFSMNTSDGTTTAGICHARGSNASLPSQWLIYIVVEDVDESAEKVEAMGGKILSPPQNMGVHGRYCVIQDPAGAVAALFTPE